MTQPNKITAVAIYVCDDCGVMDCAPGTCMECEKDMTLIDFLRSPAPAATVTEFPRDYTNPKYYIDAELNLWHGPVAPENETMHWEKFGDAFDAEGDPIWILWRSEQPASVLEVSEASANKLIRAMGLFGVLDNKNALIAKLTAATVAGWWPAWGYLHYEEIIQAGDECYDTETNKWEPVDGLVGSKVFSLIVRRRLTPPALTDVWRDTYNELDELIGVLERAHIEAGWIQVAPQFVAKMRLALAAVRGAGGEGV